MPASIDKASGEVSLRPAWRPLARRTAVAAGCFAALVSLLNHVPVSVASMRGAAAFAAVLVIAKLGLAALQASLAADARASSSRGAHIVGGRHGYAVLEPEPPEHFTAEWEARAGEVQRPSVSAALRTSVSRCRTTVSALVCPSRCRALE